MAASRSRITAPDAVRLLAAAVFVLVAARTGGCAKILAVQSMGGKSHWIFMSGIIRALLEKGHNVTAFSPYADGVAGENFAVIDISDGMRTVLAMDATGLARNYSSPFGNIGSFVKMSRQFCDMIYDRDAMKTALGSSDFDAVLVEPFMSDCMSYAAHRLNVPLIYVTAMSTVDMFKRYFVGHYPEPAIESNVFARHAVPETFYQRLTNAVTLAYMTSARECTDLLLKHTESKRYDSVPAVRPSLAFVNGHFVSAGAATATPVNVINVGGIHLNNAPDKLPEDILEFIEQSPHGVIYFTFGSTVKMSSLPVDIEKAFMETFSQIPERIIWKYEGDMKDKPKNVMTKKWLPQRDILLHPKVKLFISHGGISGIYEAVDAGVPVLGFPLFGDQPKNIAHLVKGGMAISMDLFSVTRDALLKNVLELLNNEKYAQNAKTASEIFKDRPLSPSETVVYWTEYVIRHKGAPHLLSHSWNLTWYQYYLLDVFVAVLVIIFIVVFTICKIFKSTYMLVEHIYYSRYVKSKSE